jgi:T5SS/PEP-CTERM-associated repeat protein
MATASIDGDGSSWTLDQRLLVGAWGEGTLTISGGGEVSAAEVLIGGFDASDANLFTLDKGDMHIGRQGSGTLFIEEGTRVTSGSAFIADTEGGSGRAPGWRPVFLHTAGRGSQALVA